MKKDYQTVNEELWGNLREMSLKLGKTYYTRRNAENEIMSDVRHTKNEKKRKEIKE